MHLVNVAVGEKVLLPEYGGTKVVLDDKEYYLFRDGDILLCCSHEASNTTENFNFVPQPLIGVALPYSTHWKTSRPSACYLISLMLTSQC